MKSKHTLGVVIACCCGMTPSLCWGGTVTLMLTTGFTAVPVGILSDTLITTLVGGPVSDGLFSLGVVIITDWWCVGCCWMGNDCCWKGCCCWILGRCGCGAGIFGSCWVGTVGSWTPLEKNNFNKIIKPTALHSA